jgi:hypothetical protein
VLDCTRQPTVLHLRVQEKITEKCKFGANTGNEKAPIIQPLFGIFVKIPYIIHVDNFIHSSAA